MRQLFLFLFVFVITAEVIGQNTEQEFQEGVAYYNAKDYKKAFGLFKKLSEQGNRDAQCYLGTMYSYGWGVSQDYSKAFEWFQKSANQGNTYAQNNLGLMYSDGNGVSQDFSKAFEWFQKSADQGNANAQYNLGNMYLNGRGVTKNFSQALNWYLKAAEQGDRGAQNNLGLMYSDGRGVSQDYSKAFEWFQKAAEQGNTTAQNNLASCYANGHGVTQDDNQAFFWYSKAAEQGNSEAQKNLGNFYIDGRGVTQDYNQALYWYRKAADQGNAHAQNCIGWMYSNGKGVNQDYSKAFEWFQKSAEQGNAYAQKALGNMYFYGQYVSRNYNKALEWYLKAADQGDATVMNSLGWHYYLGDSFTKDYKKAEMWFKKAIETDNASPYPYSNLALLYAQRDKNYSEALRYSDMAFARMNNQSSQAQAGFYGERGQIYVWQGDMVNAEKMLAKCLELNPDYLKGDDEFSKMMASYHSNDVDSKIITNPSINKNTFAIIIGNEKYKNEVDVPFANNDAKIFGEYVEKTLGVPHDQIRYIENAGYNDLRIAINWLTQAMTVCRGTGKAIVYYAGHGIPNESDLSAYLLPVDGIGNDPGSAYSLKDLYDKLGSVEAQSVTIFLDACFSGSKREEGMLASARGVALKAKQSAPKGNMVVFSAAQGDETAYPYKDKQHGMFTYFLLKKLQETKGDVTLGELSDYLVKEVGRESFVKNGKMQTPTANVSGSLQNTWRSIKLK